jgi:hypothetical protein
VQNRKSIIIERGKKEIEKYIGKNMISENYEFDKEYVDKFLLDVLHTQSVQHSKILTDLSNFSVEGNLILIKIYYLFIYLFIYFYFSGYRTLLFCVREIDKNEYDKWKIKYEEAVNCIDSRKEKEEECFNFLEKELELIGCTGFYLNLIIIFFFFSCFKKAVEDKLQDNCSETVDFLKQCGIRIWILTGFLMGSLF